MLQTAQAGQYFKQAIRPARDIDSRAGFGFFQAVGFAPFTFNA